MATSIKNKVWICGQGAIGSLFGAYCLVNNLDVGFISRRTNNGRIEVSLLEHTQYNSSSNHSAILLPAAQTYPLKDKVSILIVSVKAAQVIPAIEEALPYLADDCHVILSHNGLGTIDGVKSILLDTQSLYFCTTSYGALKQQNHVKETGSGESLWSLVQKGVGAESLDHSQMSQLFPNAKESANLMEVLWTKLAVNAVINPLTALHDINNGKVNDSQYDNAKHAILNELIKIAVCAAGIHFDFKTLLDRVETVAEMTTNNSSSMRQDIINKRQTEIDFINGYIVNEAQKYGLDAPMNRQMWQQIKRLEDSPNEGK